MALEYTLAETIREIWMAACDEKTDQELYRVTPELMKEDSADIRIPVEGAQVNVSSEISSVSDITEINVSDNTPETVVVNYGKSEVIDLSGNSSNEVIITAAKDLIVK